MIALQLVSAALGACLPALVVFALVLWWYGFEWTETAGVVAMIGLLCAGVAWLASFAILALIVLVF